jgi:hypothetical protein
MLNFLEGFRSLLEKNPSLGGSSLGSLWGLGGFSLIDPLKNVEVFNFDSEIEIKR